MKRVNIQSDVESRRNIATAIPNALVTKPEIVTESRNTQEDGKFKGARITLPPKPSPTPRRKEDGRPKGTLKK